MAFMEIALLIIGVIIFVISFLLPEGNEQKSEKDIAAQKEEVHRMVEQEVDSMKLRVNEATNDTVEYAVDKAERSLEKVSNEKIMAVSEYAGTIIEEINKNHKEVMFLYDMLRDKQTDITNVVRKADATVKEIEQASHDALSASETLLRGMGVATVSQRGLTSEQKAVFDELSIPDATPVSFGGDSTNNITKQKGVALAQSKIFADLNGDKETESDSLKEGTEREKVAYDILSGSAFKEGNVVGIGAPAGHAATVADFAALVNSVPVVERIDTTTQAPANNNDRIIELSRQGLEVVDIAKRLNLGVGEVKLVLDLFK